MGVWFEGSDEIDCDIQQVKDALEHYGEHYVQVISFMPGLTTVELVEEGNDHVVIRTNEGVMKRTNITKQIEAKSVTVDFDEEYRAGSKITTTSHFSDQFTTSISGVNHRTTISEVEASGVLGFFYRNLGSSNIGNAILSSYKSYFESQGA